MSSDKEAKRTLSSKASQTEEKLSDVLQSSAAYVQDEFDALKINPSVLNFVAREQHNKKKKKHEHDKGG